MQTELNRLMGSIPTDTILKKDYIMENVLPRLSAGELLSSLSVNKIHAERFLDMTLTYHVTIRQEALSDSLVSFVITEGLIESLLLDPSELAEKAVENLGSDYHITPLLDILKSFGFDASEEEGLYGQDPGAELLVATTGSCMHGAALMLNIPVLSEIYERLGAFIILPSSVHEFISMPYDPETDIPALSEMVRTINSTELLERDRLSDSVYLFDGNTVSRLGCAAEYGRRPITSDAMIPEAVQSSTMASKASQSEEYLSESLR